MDKEYMKNMVVLKNLPSNIVEEAIVVLKPNIKLKTLDVAETKKENSHHQERMQENKKKYIINEAQVVISNYLSKIEKQKRSEIQINKKIEKKYKRARIISICLGILLVLSFLS